jgi:hypothetical protein
MISWLWVTVYTLFLYAIIPFSRDLLNLSKEFLGESFSFSMNLTFILIAGMVLMAHWLKRALTVGQWGRLIAAFLLLLLFATQLEIPEERIHLLQYAVLGYLVVLAQRLQCRSITLYNRALLLVFVIGTGDELIQAILPDRFFDIRDVLFNAVGGIGGIIVRANTVPVMKTRC